jgi:hypothetical protein
LETAISRSEPDGSALEDRVFPPAAGPFRREDPCFEVETTGFRLETPIFARENVPFTLEADGFAPECGSSQHETGSPEVEASRFDY